MLHLRLFFICVAYVVVVVKQSLSWQEREVRERGESDEREIHAGERHERQDRETRETR